MKIYGVQRIAQMFLRLFLARARSVFVITCSVRWVASVLIFIAPYQDKTLLTPYHSNCPATLLLCSSMSLHFISYIFLISVIILPSVAQSLLSIICPYLSIICPLFSTGSAYSKYYLLFYCLIYFYTFFRVQVAYLTFWHRSFTFKF